MEPSIDILIFVLVNSGMVHRISLVVDDDARAADRKDAATYLDYTRWLEVQPYNPWIDQTLVTAEKDKLNNVEEKKIHYGKVYSKSRSHVNKPNSCPALPKRDTLLLLAISVTIRSDSDVPTTTGSVTVMTRPNPPKSL